MADDRIEVEIVLDDGSIQKGFAKIRKEGDKTERALKDNFQDAFRYLTTPSAGVRKLTGALFSFQTALIGTVGVLAGGALIKRTAELASVQQDAVNALNTSLATAGSFSEEASQSFQDLASELQNISVFGDEVILQQAALARNFTRTNEEAEKLTAAAVELSAATGMSLDSAVRNLGKTYAGLAGELGESIPQLRTLTAEQLKAGAAIELVANRFGGSALSQTKTFSGALTQLSNIWGDFLELLGDRIIRSPLIIEFFNRLSAGVKALSNSFGEFSGQNDVVGNAIRSLLRMGLVLVDNVIVPLEVISNLGQAAFNLFTGAIRGAIAGASTLAQALAEIVLLVDSDNKAALFVREFAQEARSQAVTDFKEAGSAVANSFNTSFSNGLRSGLQSLVEFSGSVSNQLVNAAPVNAVAKTTEEAVTKVDANLEKLRQSVIQAQMQVGKAIKNNVFDLANANKELFVDANNLTELQLQELKAKLAQFSETTLQTANQLSSAFRNGFARVIASSVQTLADGLAKGSLNFKEFGKMILGLLGDIAIQIGTTVIAGSKALAALFTGNPAGGIGFGLALVAIGALLKAGASGGISGAAGVPPAQDAITSPVIGDGIADNLQDQSRVNVTIQGNVFDGDETGLRIADILKEQGFNNAVVS